MSQLVDASFSEFRFCYDKIIAQTVVGMNEQLFSADGGFCGSGLVL